MVVNPKLFRLPSRRLMVRPEEKVPERTQLRKVLVPSFLQARVVPVMERWADDHQTDATEGPVHVGMNEEGVERQNGKTPGDDLGRKAQEDRREGLTRAHDDV